MIPTNVFSEGDKTKILDTKAPKGKTVLLRNKEKNDSSCVEFFTIVIAYNIRHTTNTNSFIFTNQIPNSSMNSFFTKETFNPTAVENVIIEFNASSFYDTINNSWDNVYDIPKRKNQTPEIGNVNGSRTYKINFIFLRFNNT